MTRPKQRARSRRAEPAAARPAAAVVFDSTVPVYMETVRETRICPELIPDDVIEDAPAHRRSIDPTSKAGRTTGAATARQKARKATAKAADAPPAAEPEEPEAPSAPPATTEPETEAAQDIAADAAAGEDVAAPDETVPAPEPTEQSEEPTEDKEANHG